SSFHQGASEIGRQMTWIAAPSTIVSFLVAYRIESIDRKRMTVIGLAVLSLTLFAAISAESASLFFWALLLNGIAQAPLGTVPTVYLIEATPPEQRGRVVALLRIAGDFGFITGPPALALLAQLTSMRAAIAVNGAVGIVVCLMAALAQRAQ